jgi:succinate dehydrogenase hydrophobic anchor subunit
MKKTFFFDANGSFHWYIQRFSALILFLTFFSLISFNFLSTSLTAFLFLFVLFHAEVGIENFIQDYMHDDFSIFISKLLLDLLVIFSLKSVFFFIIFL